MPSLSQVLAALSASDVDIDEDGRIVIKDAETARKLRELPIVTAAPAPNRNCNHGCGLLE